MKPGMQKGTSNKKRPIVTNSGTIVHLTPAQKKYADSKLANPGKPLINAAREAYPSAQPDTLRQIVNVNEKNTDLAIYNDAQASKAVLTVAELLDDKRSDVRLRAATDILDRTHGKAITRQTVQSTSVNLNVEANAALADDFMAFLKQSTAPQQ